MGNPLFGVDISGLINANIGPGVNDAVLLSVSAGTRDPNDPTAGTGSTEIAHPCRGFLDTLRTRDWDTTLVRASDQVVALIGDSIGAVPAAGDRVTILGATYEIIATQVDPAQALYLCACRA